ncbi:MAG: hypothetical protein MI757_15260, partial [Pirellulales bacterium]|nr:hypothetical protein [Pirellulales bacterium]
NGDVRVNENSSNLTFHSNTFFASNYDGYNLSGNTWSTRLPTSGKKIVVRPNEYEAGRAHITIVNWDRSSSVAVDVSGAGLRNGDSFAVYDVENYFGSPVVTGAYTGQKISIPMNTTAVTRVQGNYQDISRHSDLTFGAFVLRRTGAGSGGGNGGGGSGGGGGGEGEPAPSEPVNQAPTISGISNQTISINESTSSLSFTVGDAETKPGSLTVTGASSNTGVVPNGNIVLDGNGANRSVVVIPSGSSTGSANITLTVSDGAATSSATFKVTVINDVPDNSGPSVDVGPDIEIVLPNAASLSAVVDDDGLPNPPGIVTGAWKKTSGPGDVEFANENSFQTTATFSEPGTYTVR